LGGASNGVPSPAVGIARGTQRGDVERGAMARASVVQASGAAGPAAAGVEMEARLRGRPGLGKDFTVTFSYEMAIW